MRDTRWTVRAGDGATVAAVLARALPDDATALAEGRVFLGKERVTDGERAIAIGDRLAIFAPRAAADGVRILGQTNDLIAAEKPAALATVADHRGSDRTLIAEVARLTRRDPATLHATSRLDVGVSGVVILALTSNAAKRLAELREQHAYSRTYLAIAERAPDPSSGAWTGAIGRGRDPRLRAVNGREAQTAHTDFRTLAATDRGALLELRPRTGRTHQLRVHAAHAGLPLLGDAAYGGRSRLVEPSGAVTSLKRIALHAHRVETTDADGWPFVAVSPFPDELVAWWRKLGGDPGAVPT